MTVISASSLVRHCRYAKVLDAQREKPASVQQAADEGTRADYLIQEWLEGREPSEPEQPDEPWHWYMNFRAGWGLPMGTAQCQVPLGLGHQGEFVEVHEPEPHVYKPVDGNKLLLTAGRADLAWTADGVFDQRGLRGGIVRGRRCAIVGDLKRSAWRYGCGEPDQHPQLMALGLAWAAKTGLSLLMLGLYDLRDACWDWSKIIDLQADGPLMLAEVRGMALMGDEPRPGPWCGGCFERRNCKHAAPAPEPIADDFLF